MKTLEDQIRDAVQAAARTVAPGTEPPLRLPTAKPARRLARLRGPRHWPGWAAPLAAAAAVMAVIAASLTVPAALLRPGGQQGAASAAFGGLPEYYAALTGGPAGAQRQAVITTTATGKILATLSPPKPYGVFDYITAAGDDRTFVVAVQRWWPIQSGSRGLPAEKRDNTTPLKFFWLRVDPAARAARLAPLRIPGTLQAAQVGGIGLSPDASKLAMTLEPRTSWGKFVSRSTIRVVTLATGASRQWHWPGGGWVGNWKPMGEPLSWAADNRTLAFQQWGGKYGSIPHIRVLDTGAPGDSLSSSRLVRTLDPGTAVGNTLITPDGTKVAAVTTASGAHPHSEVIEFSARTGSVARRLGSQQGYGGPSRVLWTDRTGDRLIVGLGEDGRFGVVSGGSVTPLPGKPLNVANVVW